MIFCELIGESYCAVMTNEAKPIDRYSSVHTSPNTQPGGCHDGCLIGGRLGLLKSAEKIAAEKNGSFSIALLDAKHSKHVVVY